MLFNSYQFLFLFLPVVAAGFFLLGRHSHRLAALWLGLASLFFYGVWDARYVLLLLGSIGFNYGTAYLIGHLRTGSDPRSASRLLAAGIAVDLALLGYFKYYNFFLGSLNAAFGTGLTLEEIVLPLGISFFTFTQIAFLVDVHRGIAREYNFVHYLLFVTYFPHLIAGPVLHHKQMMPQFAQAETYRAGWENFAVGLSIFTLGLAKKVLIADTLGDYASPVFAAAEGGAQPMLLESWIGALAYTLQLYFDFSGYSDMAIGLSLIFNVRLPLNFDSPYKAASIIDFWRRWHMTLSAFLRDYLYIPLGGNQHGPARRYANLMATMLLGGLWHGANWTFVVWGGLHGLYLMVNHGWRALKQRMGWRDGGRVARVAAMLLTFLSVVVGWVFFRSADFHTALVILAGMSGQAGVSADQFMVSGIKWRDACWAVLFGLLLVWRAPNVRELMREYRPVWQDLRDKAPVVALPAGRRWRPTVSHAWALGALFALSVLSLTRVSEFLYFQF